MSDLVYRNQSELQKAVAQKLSHVQFSLITIDGKDGSGKSRLASSLAKTLSGIHIEVDQYWNENESGYIEHIRYGELVKDLENSRWDYPIVIIEGICLLDIIARIGVKQYVSIYVKRVRPNGLWADGLLHFDPNRTADQLIADRKDQRLEWATLEDLGVNKDKLSREGLDEEIIRYHYRRLPHETSDFVYERYEMDV